MPAEEPTGVLERDGTGIRYWIAGPDGAPLVVLSHGATTDHTMFDAQVPALAEHYRVLTWDAPGHGASQPLPEGFSIQLLVDDVLALVDLAGAEKAVLIGQSMGGNVSQEVVYQHPERVLALVLIGSTDNTQHLTTSERIALASAGPAFAVYPFGLLKRQSAEASAVTPEARRRIAEMMDRVADKHAYVEIVMKTTTALHDEPEYRVPVPMLLLLGEHDKLGNIAKAMPRMAERNGARFVRIAGAGHVANMDAPDIVNREILGFLGGLELG